MAVIVLTGAMGVGDEIVEPMRQAGVMEQMKMAPGFLGHWSGPFHGDYRVIELWESREDFNRWMDGTIRSSLPPGVKPADPEFIDCALQVHPD
jgi:hypothetical protein